MTITATFDQVLSVEETLALGLDQVSDPKITHKIGGTSGSLTATSTVPGTKVWSDKRQLAAGTDTFDLTALPDGNLPNKTFSGLKVQLVKIRALPTNTDTITVAGAATNPYELFGDANGQVTIPAGGAIFLYVPDLLADVGAGAKDVTVTSADVDAEYEVLLVAG